jgi:hypothetical protein
LTRNQIALLMRARKARAESDAAARASAAAAGPPAVVEPEEAARVPPAIEAPEAPGASDGAPSGPLVVDSAAAEPPAPERAPDEARPVLPPDVDELFLAPRAGSASLLRYAPCLLGQARVHYTDAKRGVDAWRTVAVLAPLDGADGNPWDRARDFDAIDALADAPAALARFAPLPAEAQHPRTWPAWSKALANHLYAHRALTLASCPALKLVARADEPRGNFIVRVGLAAREQRDREVAKLKARYAPKAAAANERVRRAEERVRRETSQYEQQKSQSMISVGATLLGALFGRKLASASSVGRATTAARGMSRAAREKEDVESATDALRRARDELIRLELAFEQEVQALGSVPAPEALGLLDVALKPRKSDTVVERVALVWVPEP